MRRTVMMLGGLLCATAAMAQLNFSKVNVSYYFDALNCGTLTTDGASTVTVQGHSFDIRNEYRMTVGTEEMAPNTVAVRYSAGSATIVVPGTAMDVIEVSAEGAHVSLTQAAGAGAEMRYVLSGVSPDGSLSIAASEEISIVFEGLSLTNPTGAAIAVSNSATTQLVTAAGSTNTLADGAEGSNKGCLQSSGALLLEGSGTLRLAGSASHALYAKSGIEMRGGTLDITQASKDGINCVESLLLMGGTLKVSGTGDDGVQVDFKDADAPAEGDTGSISISGGKVDIAVSGTAAKGLKAEGDVTISGGTIAVSVSGGGKWDSDKAKTKASTCISADGNTTVSGGELQLTATGSGDKGISTDGRFDMRGGSISVKTTGGMFAYVNGTAYDNYTGNTDNLDSDQKSSPKGIKADGDINIEGGSISVSTSGNGGEGIESKAELTVSGGTIVIESYDDAINSSSHMYIKGGDITAVAINNDALDSNGNMYISGGSVRAFGTSSPECGIDANEEEGYTVVFSGGTLLAVGGGNSVPSSSSGSTQPYVSGSGSVSAGSTISLKSGDTELASFEVPANYSSQGHGGRPFAPGGGPGGRPGEGGSSILISCPGLTTGQSYTMTNGSASTAVTAVLMGSGQGGRPF